MSDPGDYNPVSRAAQAGHPLAALMRLREEAAREVERLLTFLDETDGDSDLEPEPIESNLAGLENCAEQADEAEVVCEDEGAQCDDEGAEESGIADFDGLMEQCHGYTGSGASGFARFVA